MNLLIFPGAGNPDTDQYKQVYDVIRRETKQYGYDSVLCDVRWPGHTTDDEYGSAPSLTIPSAIVVAKAKIASMPDGPFTVLARSFGCFVALKMAQDLPTSIRLPAQMILWGPAPYWRMWEIFKGDLDGAQKQAHTKGAKIDGQFFAAIEPLESLIKKVSIPTIIASGAEDEYCELAFINYLREITKDNPLVRIKKPVEGAKHEVTDKAGPKVIQEYAAALFEE